MDTNKSPTEERDPVLWDIARKRASFKTGLITYLVVNAFLWGIWFFTGSRSGSYGWPWPIWPTLGWGVGVIFHYFRAYVHNEGDAAEREYDKLKNKTNRNS